MVSEPFPAKVLYLQELLIKGVCVFIVIIYVVGYQSRCTFLTI